MYYSKNFETDTVIVKVIGNKGGYSYITFKGNDFSALIEKATSNPNRSLIISDIEYDMNISLEDYTENAINWEVVFSVDYPEWIGIKGIID